MFWLRNMKNNFPLHSLTASGDMYIQSYLCKTAALKKSENWFSRPIIA